MTKSREEIIQSLKWSEEAIKRDYSKLSWDYACVPRVVIIGQRKLNEAKKMEAEGLLIEIPGGYYTVTIKGRKELLYPEAKAV